MKKMFKTVSWAALAIGLLAVLVAAAGGITGVVSIVGPGDITIDPTGGDTIFDSNILPSGSLTKTVGSAAYPFSVMTTRNVTLRGTNNFRIVPLAGIILTQEGGTNNTVSGMVRFDDYKATSSIRGSVMQLSGSNRPSDATDYGEFGYYGKYSSEHAGYLVVNSPLGFEPVADNNKKLGSASYRWSDTRTVLLNGADVCFENNICMTECVNNQNQIDICFVYGKPTEDQAKTIAIATTPNYQTYAKVTEYPVSENEYNNRKSSVMVNGKLDFTQGRTVRLSMRDVKENIERLDEIEETLCNYGATKYC